MNPNHSRYRFYGGRGIKVCDRWVDDFAAFVADIGDKPSSSHSIDRINNDGNYEPGNVRWATQSQQVSNRHITPGQVLSRNNKSGVIGVRHKEGKWTAELTWDKSVHYLGFFADIDDAIAARIRAEIRIRGFISEAHQAHAARLGLETYA